MGGKICVGICLSEINGRIFDEGYEIGGKNNSDCGLCLNNGKKGYLNNWINCFEPIKEGSNIKIWWDR